MEVAQFFIFHNGDGNLNIDLSQFLRGYRSSQMKKSVYNHRYSAQSSLIAIAPESMNTKIFIYHKPMHIQINVNLRASRKATKAKTDISFAAPATHFRALKLRLRLSKQSGAVDPRRQHVSVQQSHEQQTKQTKGRRHSHNNKTRI